MRSFKMMVEWARKPFYKVEEIAEECGMWCTFLEFRYFDPEKGVATDDATVEERTAYEVQSFCGIIDSDGIACLLSQPDAKLESMFASLEKLHLGRLVWMAKDAAAVIRGSGLSVERESDRVSVSALLKPFEDAYHRRLRKRAYVALSRFIDSCEVFNGYALNVQRCANEGLNCYDPKEWSRSRW